MNIFEISEIVKAIESIADDLITTDKERLELSLKEKKLEVLLISKVHETNITEAQHRSIFVASWRPAIGWIGAISLAYTYLIHPIFLWINSIFKLTDNPPPLISNEMLITIILGMLSIAGMRTF